MIAVLGAGSMGSVIAEDLIAEGEVTVIDTSKAALDKVRGCNVFLGDVFDFDGFDSVELFITALPADAAYEIVKKLLSLGKNVVDISFTDYDPFVLDNIAKKNKAIFIPHAGFAPGLSNILAGKLYYSEGSRNMEIIVGGLQKRHIPPMDYVPTFNASSVIDEYNRPARYLIDGEVRKAEPLETLESITIDGIGLLDTFYSDGLATILDTFNDASIIEKTVRYHGHLEKMKFLRDMGYFSGSSADNCSPRKVTERIFRSMVRDEKDLSILQVTQLDGTHLQFTCIDSYDEILGISSMRRMTGYSAASISSALLKGKIDETGVYPAEWIGRETAIYDFILKRLMDHGITIELTRPQK